MEQKKMDRRKELIRQYKEMKIEAGVYQIRNLKNHLEKKWIEKLQPYDERGYN